jgi:hypothetical protein
MTGSRVDNELERMWKEIIFASFEILLWHWPGDNEKDHGKHYDNK